jgi:hypothetical protein
MKSKVLFQKKARNGFLGKPEGKRPIGRHRRRCKHNITMDHREIGLGSMDLIDLAQDRNHWRALVNKVMNVRNP